MLLRQWIEREGISVADLATEIGVSRQTIYNIVRGSAPPALHIAARLEAATGGAVDILSHLSSAEKKRLERLKLRRGLASEKAAQ